MEIQEKKKPGRPATKFAEKLEQITLPAIEDTNTNDRVFGHVGKFIVINSKNIKGVRINLDKIRTYAMQNENTVALSWDNGTQNGYVYNNEKEAHEFLAVLDDYCL